MNDLETIAICLCGMAAIWEMFDFSVAYMTKKSVIPRNKEAMEDACKENMNPADLKKWAEYRLRSPNRLPSVGILTYLKNKKLKKIVNSYLE